MKTIKEFHKQRIMFVILENSIIFGPHHCEWSHSKWLVQSRIVEKENLDSFLSMYTRGFYDQETNSIYLYKGKEFEYDDKVKNDYLKYEDKIINKLGLNSEIKVFLGPKDKIIDGKEYKQIRLNS